MERNEKYTDIKEPELDDKIKWTSMYKRQLRRNKKKGSEISEPF
jgi:hypothetical protein